MTEKATICTVTKNPGIFEETIWNELVDRLSILFNFKTEKKIKFQNNKLAKLIAAIPFLANCDEPYRTALSHLTITYLASHRAGKDIFNHNFTDNKSLFKRLEPISNFNGGNLSIINRGMNLLAVIMLADHIKDMSNDSLNGKYNPVLSGIWKYNEQIKKLENEINSVECQQMDDIITFIDAKSYWWEYQ